MSYICFEHIFILLYSFLSESGLSLWVSFGLFPMYTHSFGDLIQVLSFYIIYMLMIHRILSSFDISTGMKTCIMNFLKFPVGCVIGISSLTCSNWTSLQPHPKPIPPEIFQEEFTFQPMAIALPQLSGQNPWTHSLILSL